MVKIAFRKPHFKRGFSHHGKLQTFNRIVHQQIDLLNEPFINYSNVDTHPYDSLATIWVAEDPFEAFKMNLPAQERVHDKGRLTLTYPNWKRKVKAVNMDNYVLVDGVYQNGFFLAIDKRASNRSLDKSKLNEKFLKSMSAHDSNYAEIVNKILAANLAGQFSDSQTLNRIYYARSQYWKHTEKLVRHFNKLKGRQ